MSRSNCGVVADFFSGRRTLFPSPGLGLLRQSGRIRSYGASQTGRGHALRQLLGIPSTVLAFGDDLHPYQQPYNLLSRGALGMARCQTTRRNIAEVPGMLSQMDSASSYLALYVDVSVGQAAAARPSGAARWQPSCWIRRRYWRAPSC